MSFNEYKDVIEENDTVILYIGFNAMYAVTAKPTRTAKNGDEVPNVFQTGYGAVKAADLIGSRFGCRVRTSTGGYAYALYPTPELWTRTLPHRTQILYAADIAMVAVQLRLRPGSVVVESGTGSGSLAHSIARTVGPTGHLYTFDFHCERADTARDEFKAHGLADRVTVAHRDVCRDGFGIENEADAVFLDLPNPWDAVAAAVRAIRKSTGGRVCTFSPCVEQVQKAREQLRAHKCVEIATLECLVREFQVRRIGQPVFLEKRNVEEKSETPEETSFVTGLPLTSMPGHTGYLTFATVPPDFSQKLPEIK